MDNSHNNHHLPAFSRHKRLGKIVTKDLKPSANVLQGTGGIYTFPLNLPSIPGEKEVLKTTIIGTTGCSTCVGVYIPIDNNRCFAAHFDGCIVGEPRDARNWQIPDILVDPFKDAVRHSLDRSFQGMQQEVSSIRKREDLKARVVVVSTWQVVGGRKGPGFYVIEVLCEYFQLDGVKLAKKCSGHHGFVVDHADKTPGSLCLLGWTRPAPTEQDFDQMAKIADKCVKPEWADSFLSVIETTYDFVMPRSVGYAERPLTRPGGPTRFGFRYQYDQQGSRDSKGAWLVGR